MLNQIVLVGRITSDLEINEVENKKVATMTLAVSRSFKNEEGIYETDFVPVEIFGGIAENTKEYCKQGDIVGIKGRVQTKEDKIEIIADKVTFLSSQSVKMSEEMTKRRNADKEVQE